MLSKVLPNTLANLLSLANTANMLWLMLILYLSIRIEVLNYEWLLLLLLFLPWAASWLASLAIPDSLPPMTHCPSFRLLPLSLYLNQLSLSDWNSIPKLFSKCQRSIAFLFEMRVRIMWEANQIHFLTRWLNEIHQI